MAFPSTLLATTKQPARGWGSWGGEGIRWKTWLLGFVGRLEGESPQTSLCGTLISEPNAADARRLEVVADGLPLFGGAQLAVDTTIVSTLHANGVPRRVHVDGVALVAAQQRKERRYPELVGRHGRARLLVLAVEVCGRWSQETQRFLSSPARAKAWSVPPVLIWIWLLSSYRNDARNRDDK